MLKETLVTQWSQSAWCLSIFFSFNVESFWKQYSSSSPKHEKRSKYSSSQMAHLPVAASQNSTEEIMVEFASMPPGTIMMIIMSIMVMDSWRSWWSRLSWSTLSQHTWHDHSRTTVDTNLILMRMWIHQKKSVFKIKTTFKQACWRRPSLRRWSVNHLGLHVVDCRL